MEVWQKRSLSFRVIELTMIKILFKTSNYYITVGLSFVSKPLENSKRRRGDMIARVTNRCLFVVSHLFIFFWNVKHFYSQIPQIPLKIWNTLFCSIVKDKQYSNKTFFFCFSLSLITFLIFLSIYKYSFLLTHSHVESRWVIFFSYSKSFYRSK